MRLLGVDFGFSRIGIATAETDPPIATPKHNLKASGKLKVDAEMIARLARTEEAKTIVVGLPIEPTGEEGRMARICRMLAGHLQELGFVVQLVDERLTSKEAEASLRALGAKAALRSRLVDGAAAAMILERYMHEEATP